MSRFSLVLATLIVQSLPTLVAPEAGIVWGLALDLRVCGNGVVDDGEECDDGNTDSGDGCSSTCVLEQGACCTADNACVNTTAVGCDEVPPLAAPRLFQPGEVCGVGSQQCPLGECIGRTNDCFAAATAICVGGSDNGEVCDPEEGAFLSLCIQGGGVCPGVPGCSNVFCCSDICRNVDFFCCSNHWDALCASFAQLRCSCGNNVIDPGEACDDGNTAYCDGCRGDCSAVEGTCGDGAIEPLCEACDDGNNDDGDGCSSVCAIEAQSMCSGEPSVCVTGVPAVSHWGLAAMLLAIMTMGTIVITRQRWSQAA